MDEQTLLEAEARRRGISVTQLRMRLAAPNDLMRDIVADSRRSHPSQPSSIVSEAKAEPVQRGNGWVDPRPLDPPPGIDLIDRLCDAADAQDKRDRMVRRV